MSSPPGLEHGGLGGSKGLPKTRFSLSIVEQSPGRDQGGETGTEWLGVRGEETHWGHIEVIPTYPSTSTFSSLPGSGTRGIVTDQYRITGPTHFRFFWTCFFLSASRRS